MSLGRLSLEAASSSGRTLFFNASVVHTVSPTAPSAAAWCVIDGAFSGVGSLAVATAACGASAARVNLHGAVVVPGLIDSHLHLLYGGLKLARPQLDNASSAAEVVSILLAHVAKRPVPPGGWLQGFGWDQERFPGKVYPTREDLDGAFPHTPVWLGRLTATRRGRTPRRYAASRSSQSRTRRAGVSYETQRRASRLASSPTRRCGLSRRACLGRAGTRASPHSASRWRASRAMA